MSEHGELIEIGSVKLLQVQRSSLKAGERPHRYYDPAPLLAVDRLLLTAGGCVGMLAGGEQLVDVHHAEHPSSKHRQGLNGVSIGFTSHYHAMRERFGPHLTEGIAGENILIETVRDFALADLGEAVVILAAAGEHAFLGNLLVAEPCVEFSRFAHLSADPPAPKELRATLQFLGAGRRGFYARLAEGQGGALLQLGDRVFVRPAERGSISLTSAKP
jgi:hypothetical protein